MKTVSRIALVLGVCSFVGLVWSAPALAACQNLVGGVCLDKKKEAPKKKTVKTKPAVKPAKKKPKPQPQKSVVTRKKTVKSASACVATAASKPSGYDQDKALTFSNLTVRNTCKQAIVVYVKLNPCASPRAFFTPSVGSNSRIAKLGAGRKITYKISHSESIKGARQLAATSAVYGTIKKGKVPAFGC